jgi:CheY-like chemotaxis protein
VEDNKIILLAKKIGKENNAKLYHFEATDKKAINCIKTVRCYFNGYQMPKKNGFETTIAIRKLGRSGVTPIIVVAD